jgi:Na+(H+)/acetate symporter ActP
MRVFKNPVTGLVSWAFALAATSCAPSFNYDLIGAQESYGEQQVQSDSLKVCLSAKSWGKNKTLKNNVRNLKAAIFEIKIENKSSTPILIGYKGITLASTKDTLKKIEPDDMYEKMRYRKGDAIVAGIFTSPVHFAPRYI